jgi:hypothetical protein
MAFSSFPHSDGAAWVELGAAWQDLDITPLPDFLNPPLTPEKYQPKDEAHVPTNSFPFSLGLSREATPTNLGFLTSAECVKVPNSDRDPVFARGPSSGKSAIENVLDCVSLLKLVLHYGGGFKELAALQMCSYSLAALVVEAANDDPFPWYLPLSIRCKALEDVILTSDADCRWPVNGMEEAQLAALLGPKLTPGKFAALQPQVIRIALEINSLQRTCGVGFGIVSDIEFQLNPQESRAKACYIDEFGRVHQDGIPCCLYGMHIQESDELSMLIRTSGDQLHGSFLLNGSPLNSFTRPRDQTWSPVVFFDACRPGYTPTQVRSPLHA